MTKKTKEILYWTSVALYGMLLFGILLYLRFPTEKFRSYCERIVEEKVPEISCSIGKIRVIFPFEIAFENLQLTKKDTDELIFTDPKLSLQPVWTSITNTVIVTSQLFGGISTAQAQFDKDSGSLDLSNIKLDGLKVEQASFFTLKLDRKITGSMSASGQAQIDTKDFRIVNARGRISVQEGDVQLKKPILELGVLEIDTGSAEFTIADNTITFKQGEVKNPKLDISFEGTVGIARPLSTGIVAFRGNVNPQPLFYKDKNQLRMIVARMQKRYRTASLPFKLAGTVGRPTFVFGN